MGKLIDAVQQKAQREGSQDLIAIKDELLRGETKRLNCDVPASIYKKLQLKVVLEDTSITAVINELVLEYVNEKPSVAEGEG